MSYVPITRAMLYERSFLFPNAMKIIHTIAFAVLAIGGLNWLAVGIFGWDVGVLFGGMGAIVSRVIYIVVGLAAIFEIVFHATNCRTCCSGKMPPMQQMPR